jgi:hypothetical protein
VELYIQSPLRLHIVTCRVVRATKMTGSSSDLLPPWLQVLLSTFKYSAIADLHTHTHTHTGPLLVPQLKHRN